MFDAQEQIEKVVSENLENVYQIGDTQIYALTAGPFEIYLSVGDLRKIQAAKSNVVTLHP